MSTSVLQIITRLIVGGAQETVMYTAALLDKQLYNIEVISGMQTGSEGSLIEETRSRGVSLTIFPRLLREISPINDAIVLWQLYRYIRKKHFTIVHTNSSKAGILGRLAAKLAGTPIIIHTVHGWSFHDHMAGWLKNLYILLEKLCAGLTDSMIVVTKQDIQKGLDHHIGNPTQYHLIRSAIPLDEFVPDMYQKERVRSELGIPTNALILGNVGRFSPQKNPLDWVSVAGLVAREIPESYFLLVGDGPLKEKVIQAIDEEGINDRVVLTGLRRDTAKMMSAMDVFLLTSLWEGLPRVIPQAMCMGLPVVSYQIDGIQEIIVQGENGFVFPPGDITSLATTCGDLLKDENRRKSIGENGKAFATREFNIETMIANISSLYQYQLKSLNH
jgi:glycosyltransferase involved in cell wall biosynthesis